MNLSALASRVSSSRLLSAVERSYWLSNLPRMSDAQIVRLESILEKAAALPWTDKAQQLLSLIAKATVAIAGA